MLTEMKELFEKQATAFEAFKEANDARLKSLEDNGTVSQEVQDRVEKLNTEFSSLSDEHKKLLISIEAGDIFSGGNKEREDQKRKDAMNLFLRTGDTSAGLLEKSLTSTNDPAVGYLVIPEMDSTIDRIVPTISALGRLAKQVTIGTGKWQKVMKKSGMTATRPGSGSGDGETTPPSWARIEIEAPTLEVEPWIYNETLEDAEIDLAADMAEEAGISFGEKLGSEFITGNGVGQAFGITSYTGVANASYAWGSVGYIVSGAAGAFTTSAPGDKIVNLQHALKQQYRPGASFIMADSTLGTVRQMKDGSGAYYLWQPDPLVGFGGRFLGSPVEIDDNMPTIAANSLSIGYGNWQRAYAVVNRRGTILIRDAITAKGKTKFNFTRRAGGGVYNFEAFKLMKFATS